MKKYHVLEISKNRILFLSKDGFTDNKRQAIAYTEEEAERITSEYNKTFGDLARNHYNFIEIKT